MTAESPTDDAPPKILVEFCLTPESKATLQAFFDAHGEALRRGKRKAIAALQDAIRETFPEQSLAEIKKILSGKSEYAVLVTNCPERDVFSSMPVNELTAESANSYYLGKALYDMFGVKTVDAPWSVRRNHSERIDSRRLRGRQIHRDLPVEWPLFGKNKRAQYIVFSCPLNDEHAVTEVISVRRAIEAMPAEKRKNTKVNVWLGEKKDQETLDLETVLRYLTQHTDPDDPKHVRKLFTEQRDPHTGAWHKVAPELTEAIVPYSVKVDLQPGDLLVVDEHALFHRGNSGDPAKIHEIPPSQSNSRFVIQHAGVPVKQR